MELSVEFVSMLAQAQRAIGTNSVDRYVNNMGMVAQMKPDVLDKFDSDAWADAYADMLGVDPKLIVAGEKGSKDTTTKSRSTTTMAQTRTQQIKMVDNAAKLNNAKTAGHLCMDVLNQFSGYNSPSPLEV